MTNDRMTNDERVMNSKSLARISSIWLRIGSLLPKPPMVGRVAPRAPRTGKSAPLARDFGSTSARAERRALPFTSSRHLGSKLPRRALSLFSGGWAFVIPSAWPHSPFDIPEGRS